jgi:predicted metalloprotease
MRWEGNRESDNVDDRRNEGGGGFRPGGIHLGLGGIVLVLIGSWVFHVNPLTVLSALSGNDSQTSDVSQEQAGPAPVPAASDPLVTFVKVILASTEDVWSAIFSASGQTYQPPRLEIFRNEIQTGCGDGQSAMGPFYCPQDREVYIDLGFYETLHTTLGSPGDAAQAYVIAHEVGHHIQYLTGITAKVDAPRA